MINYNDITATIKAFKRPEKLQKTIDYCLASGINKVIVGFDGDKRNYLFHKRLIDSYDNRVSLYRYDYDIGISYVRNRLLELTKTKYLYLLDDDMYIHPKSLEVIDYLNKHPDIGVVGFPYRLKQPHMTMDEYTNWCFGIYMDGYGVKSYYPKITVKKYGDIYYGTGMDTLENCAIFRTDMLKEMKGWDEGYIIEGEHVDFYLDRKLNYPHWKLATAVNVFAVHDIGPGVFLYNDTRWTGKSVIKSVDHFEAKWGTSYPVFGDGASDFSKNLYQYKPDLLKKKQYYLTNEIDWTKIW